MKKGLVVIYDPHSLHQFIWYKCTYGLEKRWDALCLPNDYMGMYMDTYCNRAGVFDQIFTGTINYIQLPMKEKAMLFAKMCFYYIIGKRRRCCKKILDEYVGDIDNYDELIAICDTGFVSGLFALLGKEKKVVYLDDGAGEYNKRSRWKNAYKISSGVYWQSFFMACMGYGCKGRFYFGPTKWCYKYSAVTSEMKYTNYKEMLNLFDMSSTDISLYEDLLNRIYPDIKKLDFESAEAIFFTDPMSAFWENYQKYVDECIRYIGNRYKSIIIKKHPKDTATYDFGSDVKVQIVDNEIPAELILDRIKGKNIVFNCISSIIIFMRPYKYKFEILYSDKMYEGSIRSSVSKMKYVPYEKVLNYCEKFAKGYYKIVNI